MASWKRGIEEPFALCSWIFAASLSSSRALSCRYATIFSACCRRHQNQQEIWQLDGAYRFENECTKTQPPGATQSVPGMPDSPRTGMTATQTWSSVYHTCQAESWTSTAHLLLKNFRATCQGGPMQYRYMKNKTGTGAWAQTRFYISAVTTVSSTHCCDSLTGFLVGFLFVWWFVCLGVLTDIHNFSRQITMLLDRGHKHYGL